MSFLFFLDRNIRILQLRASAFKLCVNIMETSKSRANATNEKSVLPSTLGHSQAMFIIFNGENPFIMINNKKKIHQNINSLKHINSRQRSTRQRTTIAM